MTPIRWPRLQSPALGTNSGTACDQRAILYMLYIRLRGMFKTGNISSDPDTSTHTPDFNSRTPPEVDQSLITIDSTTASMIRGLVKQAESNVHILAISNARQNLNQAKQGIDLLLRQIS